MGLWFSILLDQKTLYLHSQHQSSILHEHLSHDANRHYVHFHRCPWELRRCTRERRVQNQLKLSLSTPWSSVEIRVALESSIPTSYKLWSSASSSRVVCHFVAPHEKFAMKDYHSRSHLAPQTEDHGSTACTQVPLSLLVRSQGELITADTNATTPALSDFCIKTK